MYSILGRSQRPIPTILYEQPSAGARRRGSRANEFLLRSRLTAAFGVLSARVRGDISLSDCLCGPTGDNDHAHLEEESGVSAIR